MIAKVSQKKSTRQTKEQPIEDTSCATSLPKNTSVPNYDGMQIYAKQIAGPELLTPQEERALAKRIKRGDLTAEEIMIRANLRFVVHIAREFEGNGVPKADLISEGNIGLIKAIRKFDPKKGAKLSTYASYYIKQGMRRALLDQAAAVTVPDHTLKNARTVEQAKEKLRKSNNQEPSVTDIVKKTKLPYITVSRIERKIPDGKISFVSLDTPLFPDSAETVGDCLEDPNGETHAPTVRDTSLQKILMTILNSPKSNLNSNEKFVLKERFLFTNKKGEPQTLQEVAKKLKLTRERIRQIQNAALKKMKMKLQKYIG